MTKQQKGLGRGFDSLMPAEFDQSLLLDEKERIQKLFINQVVPNQEQPRRHFDEQALHELATSIKRYGILQPLIVSPSTKDNEYKIVAGERRWRAAQIAGLKYVPVIVRDQKELEELEIALIENVQRVDLSPLEQAVSIERLHQQFGVEYKQIAERLGKAETTISNIVRLLGLPEEAREALAIGHISEGHARCILSLRGKDVLQKKLLDSIIEHGWSVRRSEKFVADHKSSARSDDTGGAVKRADYADPAIEPKLQRLHDYFRAPVKLKRTKRGGRIELHFKNDKELQRILQYISRNIK